MHFVKEGIYKQYANKYLGKDQVDSINEEEVLN